MRDRIVVGNWKMNKDFEETEIILKESIKLREEWKKEIKKPLLDLKKEKCQN